MQRVHAVQDAYDDLVGALSPARAAADDVRDIARLIEELRVSLWAQQLGTARPVSEQRIYRAIDAVWAAGVSDPSSSGRGRLATTGNSPV